MKRNLLSIGLLSLGLSSLSAQAVDLTYMADNSSMMITGKALIYSGGNFILNSDNERTVSNKGKVVISGDYKKGALATAASDGNEFVNIWTGENDYGQVKILGTAGQTNALMTMEKLPAGSNYFGTTFPISFPFKDKVENVMRAFGLATSAFRGECGLDVHCTNRYAMTLFKWNNDKIHNDAVVTGTDFKAGDYYLLNLIPTTLQTTAAKVSYKGTPSPGAYSATGKSVIPSKTGTEFSGLGYNDWKDIINPYNERYRSYMGNFSSTNKYTGKNVYRFGNPYTSNLDLRAVDGANAWLKVTNGGVERTLKQATDGLLIKDFYITKRTSTYKTLWNPSEGSSNSSADYYSAKYDGTNWVGNPEALTIRPTETFNLNFPLINPTGLGSRIVGVKVDFNDAHKTFEYPSVGTASTVTPPITARMSTLASAQTKSLGSSIAQSNVNGFYQLEVFLLNGNTFEAAPVYLVGTNYNTESSTPSQSSNKIFLYGIKDEAAVENSKKLFSEFNSDTYVGKPLPVGFNNLTVGTEYELRFNQYEKDIFTNVRELSSGEFLIKDNTTGDVTRINATTTFKFIADSSDLKGRFDFYWREASVDGSGGTLTTLDNSNTREETLVYQDEDVKKIKFEKRVATADIQVFDLSGKLVFEAKKQDTGVDYTLPLLVNSVYVVNVVYSDGEVRSLKVVY